MKNVSLIFLLVLLVPYMAASQDNGKSRGPHGNIRINIDGFANDNGKAMIALANSKNSYNQWDQPFKSGIEPIKNGATEHAFNDLPYGEYAIKVFHDENNNGDLDRGPFGIPLERYGFSNNARAKFGPPEWEDARVLLDSRDLTIHITIK